jgi:3-oxoacyl-[acyl-carrier-protein] synthase-1
MTRRLSSGDVVHLGGATGRPAPVVVATAAINGLGFSPHQTWAFWRAEATSMIESPFRCPNGERATMVPVRTIPSRERGAARMVAMMMEALEQLEPTLKRAGQNARIGVALGISDRFGGRPSRALDRQRVHLEWTVKSWFEARKLGLRAYMDVPEGHASLAGVCARAASALSGGAMDLAIVGGVDTYHDPPVIADLIAKERLFDLEHPDTIIPGEGAALLVLAEPATARLLGVDRGVELQSAASEDEPGGRDSGIPCQGTGLAAVMRTVSERLVAERRRLDWLLGDVTNESYRAHELSLAFPRAFAPGGLDDGGRGYQPVATEALRTDFLPPRFGDLGAATMATSAIIATEAFARGDPAAETCLVIGSADGSRRGAVLLASRSRA